MQQFKLKISELDQLKALFSTLLGTYLNGGCIFMTDLEKVIYKDAQQGFEPPDIEVGTSLRAGGIPDTIIQRREVIEVHLDASVFGIPVRNVGGPLWSDDEKEIRGTWVLAVPEVDPITAAFDHFAPILADMFPEGSMFYTTNTTHITKRQGSARFDTPKLQVGDSVDLYPVAAEAMRTNRQITQELSESFYGVPARAVCKPMVNETSQKVVGLFGIALPRTLPLQLKEMAGNLGQGLAEVSAAMEELAASSGEIAHNQTVLNDEIANVSRVAHEITGVLNFIKAIADETKMLGLNAAIEAARAGEHGRGFGVVAEEIRKLSDESRETVSKIRSLIGEIESSLEKTIRSSESTLRNTTELAAANQETTASLEQMTNMAADLTNVSNLL